MPLTSLPWPVQLCSGLSVSRLLTTLQGNALLLAGLLLGSLAGGLATGPANAQTAFGQPGLEQPPSPTGWGSRAATTGIGGNGSTAAPPPGFDPLTGPRSRLQRDWVGRRRVSAATPILPPSPSCRRHHRRHCQPPPTPPPAANRRPHHTAAARNVK